MGQYKQKQTGSSLLLSETCIKDNEFQIQIDFSKTTPLTN